MSDEKEAPEVTHLEAKEYHDVDRVDGPPWYNDNINVGDEANMDAAEAKP